MDEKMLQRERVLPLFNEAHELASIFITTRRTAQVKNHHQTDAPKDSKDEKTINNQQSTIKRV